MDARDRHRRSAVDAAAAPAAPAAARLVPSEELHALELKCLPEKAELDCDGSDDRRRRRIDGACNNLERPFYGAANIAMRRWGEN